MSRILGISVLLLSLCAGIIAAEPPSAPSLTSVDVLGRGKITNAQIKAIQSDGILFKCDQGLVKATFTNLPPEFKTYYEAQIPKPSAQVTPSPKPKAPPPKAKQEAQSSQPSAEELALRRAYALQAYTREVATLKNQINAAEAQINQYYRQSSFDKKKPQLTTQDFEAAQASLAAYKIRMAQLEQQKPPE